MEKGVIAVIYIVAITVVFGAASIGYLIAKSEIHEEIEKPMVAQETEIQTIIISDGLIGTLNTIGVENDSHWSIFGYYDHDDNVWEYTVNITTPKEWNGNDVYQFKSESLEDVELEVKNMLKIIGYIK